MKTKNPSNCPQKTLIPPDTALWRAQPDRALLEQAEAFSTPGTRYNTPNRPRTCLPKHVADALNVDLTLAKGSSRAMRIAEVS
jgi:hypothetical protein